MEVIPGEPSSGPHREEFCLFCGRRRPLYKLHPLVSAEEETRQYACLRAYPCWARKGWQAIRKGWQEKSIDSLLASFFGDD